MRTGQCMCGAVKYRAETENKVSVCYCKMCQRWASGVFMGAMATDFEVTEGEEHLGVVKSSDWAERGFCKACGSNLFYRVPGQYMAVAFGSLDDTTGLSPRIQFYVDKRPEGFELAAKTKEMTEAECIAFFAPEEAGDGGPA
ncbi:MAG: GFA family protein [Paracoccaceae bacterium]|nr:GFA family protein [Paracoccaceae bacterium]